MIQPSRSVQLRSGREMEPVAVSLDDAAAMIGVSPSFFRRRLAVPATGPAAIASFIVGRRRVVAVAEIRRWADAQTESARQVAAPVPTAPVVSVADVDESEYPIAVLRALGRTNKRPRIHAVPRSPPATDAA